MLTNNDYQKSKSYCEFLTEGKFFPRDLCPRKALRHTLFNILRQRTEDERIRHAVQYMSDVGALLHTRQTNHPEGQGRRGDPALRRSPEPQHLALHLDKQISTYQSAGKELRG